LVGKCYGGSEEKCGGIYGKQGRRVRLKLTSLCRPNS